MVIKQAAAPFLKVLDEEDQDRRLGEIPTLLEVRNNPRWHRPRRKLTLEEIIEICRPYPRRKPSRRSKKRIAR